MINNVTLVGRITKDPVLRKSQSGLSVVSFTLACNRRFTNSQGGHDTDFINCVVWKGSADFVANYVKQGDLLGIEGRIQTRNYQDQSGRTVYVTEVLCESVQMLAHKQTQEQAQAHEHVQVQTNDYGSNYVSDTLDIASDDLPF